MLSIVIGLLLIFFSTFKSKDTKKENSSFTYKDYTIEIEEKIENFLLNVDGIKNVNVIVTLDTLNNVSSSDDSSFFNIKDNDTYEVYPTVRGVAISCTNGDNDMVKNKITKLVSAYLGISSNRIEIVNFG